MSEARKFTSYEIESMFAAQWSEYMDEPTARKAFHKVKAWLGPRYWNVLVELPMTTEQLDHLFNVLPRAKATPGETPSTIMAEIIGVGCKQLTSLDAPLNHEHLSKKPDVVRVGNVIRAAFGKRNETTDSSDM